MGARALVWAAFCGALACTWSGSADLKSAGLAGCMWAAPSNVYVGGACAAVLIPVWMGTCSSSCVHVPEKGEWLFKHVQGTGLDLQCTSCASSFRGKHVLITGSSQGIGKKMALQLAKAGAKLTLTARSSSKLEQVIKECMELGAEKAVAVPGDMADADFASTRLLAESRRAQGSNLDLLIINHAIISYSLVQELESSEKLQREFEASFQVNAVNSISLLRSALPQLAVSNGHVVGISTLGVYFAQSGLTGYVSSKAAFHTFLESLQVELALTERPVSIGIIHLGEVSTEHMVKSKQRDDGGTNAQPSMEISPEYAAESIICAASRRLKNGYVPVFGYLLSWLGIVSQPIRPQIALDGFFKPRPDMHRRLDAVRQSNKRD